MIEDLSAEYSHLEASKVSTTIVNKQEAIFMHLIPFQDYATIMDYYSPLLRYESEVFYVHKDIKGLYKRMSNDVPCVQVTKWSLTLLIMRMHATNRQYPSSLKSNLL